MNKNFLTKALLALTVLASSTLAASQARVIGYLPYWAQYAQFYPKDIRFGFVTQVHYGYFTPDAAGNLQLADASDQPNLDALLKLAKENNVQVVISVGGPGNAENMKAAASGARDALVKNIVALVQSTGAAGIEIDWALDEANKADYAALFDALSSAFASESPKPLLTASLPWDESHAAAYPVASLQKADYVTVQAIDLMDESKTTLEPNASGVVTAKALEMWAAKGIEAGKLVAVVPFYGRSYLGAKGLGSSFTGPGSGNEGVLNYKDLMGKFDGDAYKVSYDEASQSEVAVSKDETIVFSGIPSIKAVAQNVKAKGYGGVAAYDLSGDFPQWKVSLLVTIGSVLRPEVDYKGKSK